jgi:hypothetical protein
MFMGKLVPGQPGHVLGLGAIDFFLIKYNKKYIKNKNKICVFENFSNDDRKIIKEQLEIDVVYMKRHVSFSAKVIVHKPNPYGWCISQ